MLKVSTYCEIPLPRFLKSSNILKGIFKKAIYLLFFQQKEPQNFEVILVWFCCFLYITLKLVIGYKYYSSRFAWHLLKDN